MIRLALLGILAFACLAVADTRAAFVNGARANGFTFRDGFWFRGGLAYTRARVPCAVGCNTVRYSYRRAAAVVVNNKIVTPQTVDWKAALAKYKAQLQDNQDFITALGGLSPGYAQSRIQSYQYGNGVNYAQSSIASIYGDNNPALLYQQSARLAESAQGYGADATAAFANLVGLDAAGRARAAEIIAAGQAVSQARSGGVRVQVQSSGQSLPAVAVPVPAPSVQPPPIPQEEDREPPGPVGALPSSAATCMSCHSQGKEAAGGGFAFLDARGQARKLNALELLSISARTRLPADDPKAMPPKSVGKPLSDNAVADWQDWIHSRAQELKASK